MSNCSKLNACGGVKPLIMFTFKFPFMSVAKSNKVAFESALYFEDIAAV